MHDDPCANNKSKLAAEFSILGSRRGGVAAGEEVVVARGISSSYSDTTPTLLLLDVDDTLVASLTRGEGEEPVTIGSSSVFFLSLLVGTCGVVIVGGGDRA